MKTNIKQTYKALSIVLALVLTLAPFAQLHAAPPQPENVTISGDETKPTVSWDSVEAETNGVDWTEETNSAAWSARRVHATTTYDNKLWVLGGYDGTNRLNDVWYSADGSNWNEATNNAPWTERQTHTTAVFDGKLWVIGGYDGTTNFNDVWHTEDGENWTEATNSAAWSARRSHTTTVFDGKIWVMGGFDGSGNCNGNGNSNCRDVWYSEDGVNWTEATNSAGWSARNLLTSAAFDNKLWVMGGNDGSGDCNGSGSSRCSDVWYSEDGTNWTEATNNADWPERNAHTTSVFNNKLWVMGGYDGNTGLNDIWYSDDGVNWAEATGSADWSARQGHATSVFSNKLWTLGGTDGANLNDIWSTPNNSISHYKVCWDKTEGECGKSAKVDPDGEVISLNSSDSSWLAKLKDKLIPGAHAQSGELSYTLENELDSGTWHFSVTAVTMAGEESTSPGTATHDVSDSTAGLPDTGYGTQDSGYMNYALFTLAGIGVLTGGYYLKQRRRNGGAHEA